MGIIFFSTEKIDLYFIFSGYYDLNNNGGRGGVNINLINILFIFPRKCIFPIYLFII